MDNDNKARLAAVGVAAVLVAILAAYAAFAAVQNPQVYAAGTVTKDVLVGQSIWLYNWTGVDQHLPFDLNGSITVNFNKILFSPGLMNKTIGTLSAQYGWSASADYLTNSYNIPYFLLTGTNTSTPSAGGKYNIATMDQDVDVKVTNDKYLLMQAVGVEESGINGIYHLIVTYTFLDEGGTTRYISMILSELADDSEGITYNGADTITVIHKVTDVMTSHTLQMSIKQILDTAGVSWQLSKLTGIEYKEYAVAGDTAASASQTGKGAFYVALVTDRTYINRDDADHLVNGTSLSFNDTEGVINVYGTNATKILDVAIPFVYKPDPEMKIDSENTAIAYKWPIILPKSDELTYSNTVINMTLNKAPTAFSYLYVKGTDALSNILDKNAGDTVTLASSLVPGDQYDVETKVKYTLDELDELTQAPAFFSNPAKWIADKIWAFLIFIAGALGLSTAGLRKQRLRYKTVRK